MMDKRGQHEGGLKRLKRLVSFEYDQRYAWWKQEEKRCATGKAHWDGERRLALRQGDKDLARPKLVGARRLVPSYSQA